MITAVVGGQFGSEGKGAVVADLANLYATHVRVGAANAGHTFYTDGEKHVVQQLPCAAYVNPAAQLVLGPGALISEHILQDEIGRNAAWREEYGQPPLKLLIDKRAHIITQEQIEDEAHTDLAERIGSTSTIAREGIGQATADRIMRSDRCVTAYDHKTILQDMSEFIGVGDAAIVLQQKKTQGHVLLEGTQGAGLSITTGFFPYCTSRNTTASGLAADCGLGPGDIEHCIIVVRTFPIRVAGPSGPFYPDSNEINFEELGVEPEKTTVTKLERRVATFSIEQVQDAVRLNHCPSTEIALMFADYVAPDLAGVTDGIPVDLDGAEELVTIFRRIAARTNVSVSMVGTGPSSMIRMTAPLALQY